jgi:hypothetical protein
MGMAERVYCNARREIEISLATLRNEPYALASLEPKRGSGKSIEQWRGFGHGSITPSRILRLKSFVKRRGRLSNA